MLTDEQEQILRDLNYRCEAFGEVLQGNCCEWPRTERSEPCGINFWLPRIVNKQVNLSGPTKVER